MWALDLVSFQLPQEGEMKRPRETIKKAPIPHFYSPRELESNFERESRVLEKRRKSSKERDCVRHSQEVKIVQQHEFQGCWHDLE